MRQVLGWMMVLVLCCAARGDAGQEKSDARLLEAQAAFDEATRLNAAGSYSAALARAEHALALREAVLGATHPDVASCLNLEGELYLRQGSPARAEPFIQRALAIWEAALGKSHPFVARALNNLALVYRGRGLFGQAEPFLQRALAIQETALGKSHPDVALTLNNLAALSMRQGAYGQTELLLQRALTLQEAALGSNHLDAAQTLNSLATFYSHQGEYGRAEPLYQRALAIQEAALDKSHPDVAQTLSDLAALYWQQGLYGQSEPLFLRAIALQEVALGNSHPILSTSLNNLALLYSVQGLYDQAEPLIQRALTIQQAALGENHPLVASTLDNLAILYMEHGSYGRAEPLYQRALAIRELAFGKSHHHVASTLNNLALLYVQQGLYGRAEPLLQRALAIQEAAFGKSHLHITGSLNNLALLYMHQGLYERAEPVYQRTLAIQEAALSKSHPDIARSLDSLARLYEQQGFYARAEPLLRRALAIREEAFGKDHPDVAYTLQSLAILYRSQGLYGRAEPLLQRALTLQEAAMGKSHPDVARSLGNLARLYVDQGLYGRAEPLLQRALAIQEATLGDNHPEVAQTLTLLAVLRLAQHRLADAQSLYTRALAISERRLRQEALDFSEERLSSFLQYLRADEQALYALLRAHPADVRVQRLALSAALLLKGRSLEETANISRTLYRSLDAQAHNTLEQLRSLRTQMATLSLAGRGSLTVDTYKQRLAKLGAESDALEAELAKHSASLRALTALPPPAEIVDRVAASLPKDGALVELVAYEDRPLIPRPGKAPTKTPRQMRYLALVLFPDASTRALDLGPAAPIDLAATRLRDALARRDAQYKPLAQALYRLAFQPLQPLLGNTRRLYLSPDGQLSLVSYATLHDGRGFLLDSFDFSYLTSGRELLPRPEGITPSSSIFVLADPDFSAAPQARTSTSGPLSTWAGPPASLERFISTARADAARNSWVPLPGTRQEAESIHRLLPQAEIFLGPEATKERLLHLPSPGILHVATHGFFLEDAPTLEGARAMAHFGALSDPPPARISLGPLLRSGLALAGARAPASDASTPSSPIPDTSLVTALELAGLDLWGTQLVILSACDTGRGDVKLGQGVYGLRRAFVVAGAETVVMSLWKVDDATTKELMEAYYRNLIAGQGRAAALREAMRAVYATQPHPHYWAPFIVLGQDAPLQRIRGTGTQGSVQPP